MLRFILSDSVAPNQSILSRLAEKTDRSRDGVTLKTLALQGENYVAFFRKSSNANHSKILDVEPTSVTGGWRQRHP